MTANAALGRGRATGDDTSYGTSHVEAGNKLGIESDGDTTIKGAVASGKQAQAKVGGNLTVESLQDTSSYDSKQQNIGGSITVGYGGASGSISAGQQKMKSSYASVREQSGIKAGDGGFQVSVKGNTDLKGAVISSTDKAVTDGKNSFTTAKLTASDIENRAEYDASGFNVGLGISASTVKDKDGNIIKNDDGSAKTSTITSATSGIGSDNGNAGSVTTAGISGIAGD
ncbi:hypothetical protein EG834_00660 [bacterium]|nr:hypothetical protein [bacterium]